MNGFGLEGARALEGALKENKYLTDLNISYCRIPDEAAVHIAGGLQHNDTLEKLNVTEYSVISLFLFLIFCRCILQSYYGMLKGYRHTVSLTFLLPLFIFTANN
jgi:hypothetical protein